MEILEREHWWDERLTAWTHEGFDVTSFRNKLLSNPDKSSELLLDFEQLISDNRSLRKRVIESSMPRSEKSNWLKLLDDVIKTEDLVVSWEKNAAENRPWEPYVHKAEPKWVERGKASALTSIINRLNSLDKSSYSACQPLYILLEDVESDSIISAMLSDIESDEERRRDLVNDMIETLRREGIDASDAAKMNIVEALNHLDSLQSEVEIVRRTRLKIEKDIRPFDSVLAENLLSKINVDMVNEINAIADNLDTRFSSLKETITEWERQGIIFPQDNSLIRENLLDWESELPEIEKLISIHLKALKRWKDFQKFWPDKCEGSSSAGKLGSTEEFVDLVDSLDQEWRELELHGMQIVDSWEDKGFAMDIWRTRLLEEPRSALDWLKKEEAGYQKASSLIDSLLSLDSSLYGEDEIVNRVTILREFELDSELLRDMENYVDTKVRRTARHRSLLEKEWMELVRKGVVDDASTSSLSLYEFEQLIRDSRISKGNRGIPIKRVEEKLRKDIEAFEKMGYDVGSMEDLLTSNPMELALRINDIKQSVDQHESIRNRISSIDWRRDPSLSAAVNIELSQPDRLNSLTARIPDFVMRLSRKEVVDPDFQFQAWKPHPIAEKPQESEAKDNIDDAMEAILEEMDVSNEPVMSSEIEDSNSTPTQDVTVVVDEIAHTPLESSTQQSEQKMTEGEVSTLGHEIIDINQNNEDESPAEPEVEEVIALQNNVSDEFSPLLTLLRNLGFDSEANLFGDRGEIMPIRRALATSVGVEPRDMRLDRLLRLALRLLPNGSSEDDERLNLISKLAKLADELSKWTRTRLEARHVGSKGILIEDAEELGLALERIPGPGTALPLESDDFVLPGPDDIEGLSKEVDVLNRRILLSSAGGVR